MMSTRRLLVVIALLAGSLVHAERPAEAQIATDCTTVAGSDGCWLLDLNEEFNGATLNPEIWEPGWFVDSGYSKSVADNENACYNSDQVSVANGRLSIRLDESTSPQCLDKHGDVAPYVGGLISSRDAIRDPDHPGRLDGSFYLESRIRIPAIDGQVRNWGAFWSTGFGPWPVTGEFDVLESLRGEAKFNYHYECPDVGGRCQAGATPHPAASSDGRWHTYAVKRTVSSADTPATVTFFFDGEPVGTITENVVDSPHYIIFTYSSHRTHDTTTTGVAMEVAWVRTYRPAGDVTCDGSVTEDDVTAILRHHVELVGAETTCPLADPATSINVVEGDLNGDDLLNIADTLALSQCLASGGC